MATSVVGLYRANANAPLTIYLPDDGLDYYFKLMEGAGLVTDFLIQRGGSISLKAPSGTFTLRYARGQIWSGITGLFGEKTETFKLTSPLVFGMQTTPDGTRYTGHKIQLQKVPRGNIADVQIPREQF